MCIAGRMLALDLIGLPIDQNRKHVASRKHRVHLDVAAIQPAPPTGFLPLQFEPKTLSVDGYVVDHKYFAMRNRNLRSMLLPLLPASNLKQPFCPPYCSGGSSRCFRCWPRISSNPGCRINQPRSLRLPDVRPSLREVWT